MAPQRERSALLTPTVHSSTDNRCATNSTIVTDESTTMSEVEAREVTNSIRQSLAIAASYITKAYAGRAWFALGYDSWDAYVDAEDLVPKVKLDREERAELVVTLRESGMSVRAIASAAGISKNTVKADLAQVGQSDPPGLTLLGSALEHFGLTDPANMEAAIADPSFGTMFDEFLAETNTTFAKDIHGDVVLQDVETGLMFTPKIVGTDGKTYQPRRRPPRAPITKPPHRTPITSVAETVGRDLRRVCERIQLVQMDDRFARNREAISESILGNVECALSILQDMLIALRQTNGGAS